MGKKLEIKEIFSKVASKYDLMNNVISFSIHKLWERKLLSLIKKHLLETTNYTVYENSLDLCTGTGVLLHSISEFSKNLYALDISKQMLEIARKRKELKNLKITYIEGEAEHLPFDNDFFDLIVVSYGVRNFYSLNDGLKEISRCLKENGILYILEFGKPRDYSKVYKKYSFKFFFSFIWQKIFTYYFKYIMPIIVRIFSADYKSYQYLSSSALNFLSGDDFVKILSQNNLSCKSYKIMLGGFVYIYICNPQK